MPVSWATKLLTKVMQLDALCVYVTFVDELASLGEQVVSMMSTIVPENPAERTYKVVRKPADGLAYALAIAEKHGLTYERLRGQGRAMKVHLLYEDQDFDFAAGLPPGHEDADPGPGADHAAAGDGRRRQVPCSRCPGKCCSPASTTPRPSATASGSWPTASPSRRSSGRCTPSRSARCRTGGACVGRLRRHATRPLIQPVRCGQPSRGLRGPPQAAAADRRRPCREVPAPTGCGRCSPRCSANWTTSTSRRSATT